MKKRICGFLALCLVLAMLPAAHALAADETYSLDVSFQRMDHSISNDYGEIELFYDLLQVPQDYPYRLQMDMALVEDYFDYVLSIQGLDDFLMEDWPYEQYYFNTISGDVMYNRESLLSLRYSMEWYMGGVHNYGWYGVTFNLNTGKTIGISELLGLDSWLIMDSLRPIILDYAENHGGWERSELQQTVNAYTLDDLDFYVDWDGEIILCFPQYELGPGASGPMAIPTGLYAEGAPRETGEESLLDILMSPSGGSSRGIELRSVWLTAAKQYEINIFLSNFAEQYGFNEYPGSDVDHVIKMVDFAHMYCKINDRSGIEYMNDRGSAYETVSLEKVNAILNRFFGETLTAEAANRYVSDWGFYRDARFWYPAADGESFNEFVVVDYMSEVYEGVYYVNFTVYSLDLDVYFDTGLTRAYYELTPEAAAARSDIDITGYGAAIVTPYDLDGRSTYQLQEYLTWW